MRGIKKSRYGCATCKSKRLKCDERRPSCGRCTRLGMKCPGYAQPFRWVTKHEVFEAIHTEMAPKEPSNQPALLSDLQDDQLNADISEDVSSNVSNANAESPPLSSLGQDATTTLLNEWDQSLDMEHFEHEFSMNLPELEHLDTPPATTEPNLELASAVDDLSQISSLNQHKQTMFSDSDQAVYNNRTSQRHSSTPSLFRRQFSIDIHAKTGQLNKLSFSRRSLEDPSSTLVEYYFKEVAGLFSSYDSHMNPFRTTVSRLWTSSPAVCLTLQSMAAATLVDDFPQFGPVGLKMRREAISILQSQESLNDKSLLAMLMLGQTASWHDPNDLGITFFNTLRKHLNSLSSDRSILTNRNNYQFFEEALVYWEMLLSYVADHNSLTSSAKMSLQTVSDHLSTQKVPHPWTGICRDTQFLVHKVGQLVRRERRRVRAKRFTSLRDVTQAQEAIQEARELEERLLSLAHPTETDVVNPGDNDTPVWHLLTMAEVYRHTGLVQLYRVFPDLLRDRLQAENIPRTNTEPNSLDLNIFPQSDDVTATFLDSPNLSFDTFGIINNRRDNDNDDDSSGGRTDDLPEEEKSEWLTRIALIAMSRLKTIPLESRTRCLQPFLLVASSSELPLPPMKPPTLDPRKGDYLLNLSAHTIEVSRTRKFILGRLTSFLHVLPPKPIHICVELVQEVWRRMDAGEPDVYWMDVMIENGWETTMG